MSRSDILYPLHEYSKYMDKPTLKVWEGLLMIVRYLAGTIDFGIVMRRPKKDIPIYEVEAWVDSNWARCQLRRKSRSGGFIKYYGQTICWFSEMQTATAQSTCESETYGIVKMAKLLSWLRDVLTQIDCIPSGPFKVWCDCKSAIDLCNLGQFSKRSRHYDIAVNVAYDFVESGLMEVSFLPNAEMVADFYTNPCLHLSFTCGGLTLWGAYRHKIISRYVWSDIQGCFLGKVTRNH